MPADFVVETRRVRHHMDLLPYRAVKKMPDTTSKKSNHIGALARSVTALLEDVRRLKELAQEAQDLHYSDPDPAGLTDADFAGENAYLSAAVYKGVVQTLLGLDSQMAAPGASGAPSVYATLRQMKP